MTVAEHFLIDTPRERTFDRLVELACRALDADTALITLIGNGRQFFKADYGLGEPWATWRETPVSHSFCVHVAEMGAPLLVEDSLSHPLVSRNPAIEDLGVYAYLGHPVRDSDGRSVGAICVIQGARRAWSRNDAAQMRIFAELVSLEIARAARRKGRRW